MKNTSEITLTKLQLQEILIRTLRDYRNFQCVGDNDYAQKRAVAKVVEQEFPEVEDRTMVLSAIFLIV